MNEWFWGALGAFALREIWDLFKGDQAKLKREVSELSLAVARLSGLLEHLAPDLHRLPRVQADVDAAHKKIRDLIEASSGSGLK